LPLLILFAVILSLVVGPIVVSAVRQPKPASRPQPKPAAARPAPTIEDAFAWQESHNRFLARVTDAAEKAAAGDAYAEGLVKAFREQVKPARVMPGGSYQIILGSTMPKTIPFPIVLVSGKEVSLLDHRPVAVFTFSGDAFIFLADQPWQDWFLGVIALHEMVHWDDQVLSKRESMSSRDNEWVAGEVRAHDVEIAALDRLTGGKFLTAIRSLVADPARCVKRPGQAFCTTNDVEVEQRLIASIWPDQPKSEDEFINRGGSIAVAIVLAQASDQQKKIEAYKWFMARQAMKRL